MQPDGNPPRSRFGPRDEPAGTREPRFPAYAVGIVNFRTYADLERCLTSVKFQTVPPARVVVVDNDPIPEEFECVRLRYPEVMWEARPNCGFPEAANRILWEFRTANRPAEFFLILNPDVELEADFAENLLDELVRCDAAALACGKLLRPEAGRIDSAGIVLPRHRRPRDRGSEEMDRGQYDRTEFVFGASGAALMLRGAALDDLAIDGEIFDQDFFIYHEDTDLSWRANLLGWRVLYVPQARAVHGRHWRRDRRFHIAPRVRRHSFKNHYLQMIKNERVPDFLVNLPAIALWELLRLGYALLRDREVLGGYREAWRCSGNAWRKRRILQQRVRDRNGYPVLASRRLAPRTGASAPVGAMDHGDRQPRHRAV